MNRKILAKTALILLVAFFAAGDSCNGVPRVVTSEQMIAADVFTYYRVEEYTKSDGGGKCTRRVTMQFSDDKKEFRLQPPARVTVNGADASGEFGCEKNAVEFVLTDNHGGTKSDAYELEKVRLDFPAQIDRARDLRIPIEYDEAYVYDFSGTIGSNDLDEAAFFRFFRAENEADLAARLNDPDMAKDLAYFLPQEKLLVIPQHLFARLAPGDLPVSIGVAQKIFKPKTKNPESSLESAAFAYEYSLDAKLKLK